MLPLATYEARDRESANSFILHAVPNFGPNDEYCNLRGMLAMLVAVELQERTRIFGAASSLALVRRSRPTAMTFFHWADDCCKEHRLENNDDACQQKQCMESGVEAQILDSSFTALAAPVTAERDTTNEIGEDIEGAAGNVAYLAALGVLCNQPLSL